MLCSGAADESPDIGLAVGTEANLPAAVTGGSRGGGGVGDDCRDDRLGDDGVSAGDVSNQPESLSVTAGTPARSGAELLCRAASAGAADVALATVSRAVVSPELAHRALVLLDALAAVKEVGSHYKQMRLRSVA